MNDNPLYNEKEVNEFCKRLSRETIYSYDTLKGIIVNIVNKENLRFMKNDGLGIFLSLDYIFRLVRVSADMASGLNISIHQVYHDLYDNIYNIEIVEKVFYGYAISARKTFRGSCIIFKNSLSKFVRVLLESIKVKI
jgi:hypothetical protein